MVAGVAPWVAAPRAVADSQEPLPDHGAMKPPVTIRCALVDDEAPSGCEPERSRILVRARRWRGRVPLDARWSVVNPISKVHDAARAPAGRRLRAAPGTEDLAAGVGPARFDTATRLGRATHPSPTAPGRREDSMRVNDDLWLMEEPLIDDPSELLTIPELKRRVVSELRDDEIGLRALLERPERLSKRGKRRGFPGLPRAA
jgi:hypothetical protein